VVAVLMMKRSHISAGQIANPMMPKAWIDVGSYRALVRLLGSRLTMLGHVLPQEPIRKRGHRNSNLLLITLCCWILPGCFQTQELQRFTARAVRCPW
jgi:hypothetical protein